MSEALGAGAVVTRHDEDRIAVVTLDSPANRNALSRRLLEELRATITDRVNPGVDYTTFHHPDTQANVVTTDYSDWATNCPEYKVTAVQVALSNGPTEWQEEYTAQATLSRRVAAAE